MRRAMDAADDRSVFFAQVKFTSNPSCRQPYEYIRQTVVSFVVDLAHLSRQRHLPDGQQVAELLFHRDQMTPLVL